MYILPTTCHTFFSVRVLRILQQIKSICVLSSPTAWMTFILLPSVLKNILRTSAAKKLRCHCSDHLWTGTTAVPRCLKCYYDQKITSLFPSDFQSVFVWHFTGKILSFEFYSKAVSLSACLGFHGPPLFTFKTDWLDFRAGLFKAWLS